MTSRDALIVVNAATQDPHWLPLVGVERAANELAEVLHDRSIGGFDDVAVLRDEPAHVLMGSIERFLHGRSPDDLLLLYFCGYLAPDDREYPYFVTMDSIPARLSSTALDIEFVKMWLDRCLSRRVVLFLDCGFPSILRWDVGRSREQPDLSESLHGPGRVVIAAPPPSVGYAAEPADLGSSSSDTSAFTQALIDGLRTGDADRDRDGVVGLGELFEHLRERVREAGMAAPSKFDQIEGGVAVATALGSGAAGRTVGAASPVRPYPEDRRMQLPADLQESILSPTPDARISAIAELRRRAQQGDVRLDLAREILARMTDDDSRPVASAARAALAEIDAANERSTDRDRISDEYEDRLDLDPTSADSDADGLTHEFEASLGLDPTSADSDADGLTDEFEASLGTDPTSADSDHDGLTDEFEELVGAYLDGADSDADGVVDSVEAGFGSDPTRPDSDDDGLTDEFEKLVGAYPDGADADADGWSDLEENAPSAATAPVIDRDVQFTVYSPRQIVAEHWAPLLVYAHKGEPFVDPWGNPIDPVQEVDQRARSLFATGEEPRLLRADLQQSLARGTSITIAPDFPMLRCNPSFVTLDWLEPIHEVPFRISAPAGLSATEVRGWVRLWCGLVILAEVSITVPLRRDGQPDPTHPPRTDQMRTDQMRRYRKIFPSYSHRDSDVVDQFRNAAVAIGDDYLMDVVALRSGENWRAALSGLINEADVFQLFWSSNSMRSHHCRAEWEHALALARPEFIRPVFWEEPMPRAPELGLPTPELSRLHFARLPELTPRAVAPYPTAPQPTAPQPTAPQPTAPQPTAQQPMAPRPWPPAGGFERPPAGGVGSEWGDLQLSGQPQGGSASYSPAGPPVRRRARSQTLFIGTALVAGLIAVLVIAVLVGVLT